MSKKKIVLIVIGIVLFLGAIPIAAVLFSAKKIMDETISEARDIKTESDLKMLQIVLTAYERSNRFTPPTQEQGLQALVEKPTLEPVPVKWRQMVASPDDLIDPWGNPYQYRNPATKSEKKYDLWSFGPDGIENENDIGNW